MHSRRAPRDCRAWSRGALGVVALVLGAVGGGGEELRPAGTAGSPVGGRGRDVADGPSRTDNQEGPRPVAVTAWTLVVDCETTITNGGAIQAVTGAGARCLGAVSGTVVVTGPRLTAAPARGAAAVPAAPWLPDGASLLVATSDAATGARTRKQSPAPSAAAVAVAGASAPRGHDAWWRTAPGTGDVGAGYGAGRGTGPRAPPG